MKSAQIRGPGHPRIIAPVPLPPSYWRRITLQGGLMSALQARDWLLVLSAARIPWRLGRLRGARHIFVPAFLEQLALGELEGYAAESLPRKKRVTAWPLHKSWFLAPLYLLLPALFHVIQNGNFMLSGSALQLEHAGSLDAIKILIYGEWHRVATALFLHTNAGHLAGNLFFGSIFLALLARICGLGHAWLMAFAGGAAGNAMSIFVHSPGYASIGFSTAVFASVGALAGLLLWRSPRKIFMPLAAAAGILALLGTQGANTDYGAHICGLLAGCGLGFCEGIAISKGWLMLPQFLAGLLAVVLPCCAWFFALA